MYAGFMDTQLLIFMNTPILSTCMDISFIQLKPMFNVNPTLATASIYALESIKFLFNANQTCFQTHPNFAKHYSLKHKTTLILNLAKCQWKM